MAKTLLVEPDVRAGEDILNALDAADFPWSAAFWLYEADEHREGRGEWNLVIASPLYDKAGPKEAYHQLFAALNPAGNQLALLSLRLEGNKHRLIKGLRKLFSKKNRWRECDWADMISVASGSMTPMSIELSEPPSADKPK